MTEHTGFHVQKINTFEMYPRKRPRCPEPQTSIHSRKADPNDKLVPEYVQIKFTGPRLPRIHPPSTSETAVLRNNYFS